jgi:hypothetical protein
MYMFLEDALSDAFKIFLAGMIIYSIFFAVLLRFTFYRTRSFARKHLRNLENLREFMEKKDMGAKEAELMEGHELLNNIIARYRGSDVRTRSLSDPLM